MRAVPGVSSVGPTGPRRQDRFVPQNGMVCDTGVSFLPIAPGMGRVAVEALAGDAPRGSVIPPRESRVRLAGHRRLWPVRDAPANLRRKPGRGADAAVTLDRGRCTPAAQPQSPAQRHLGAER